MSRATGSLRQVCASGRRCNTASGALYNPSHTSDERKSAGRNEQDVVCWRWTLERERGRGHWSASASVWPAATQSSPTLTATANFSVVISAVRCTKPGLSLKDPCDGKTHPGIPFYSLSFISSHSSPTSSFTSLSRTLVAVQVDVDFINPAFSVLPSCGTLHHHRPG